MSGKLVTRVTTDPHEAAAYVRRGEPVAFPTETVYGLGALIESPGIERIFAIKGRPSDNPLIVHLARAEEASALSAEWTANARALAAAFWPGPLTLVVKKGAHVPTSVSAGLDTVGLRVPRHALARAFLVACGGPVAAPSANLSGRPSPTRFTDVLHDLDGRVACILRQDELTETGLESTVVDVTSTPPRILRRGSLTQEALARVCRDIEMATGAEALRRSPGTRHRHYAPRAKVELVTDRSCAGDATAGWIGLTPPTNAADYAKVLVVQDLDQYARHLFAFFRACDEAGLTTIRCLAPDDVGLGAALLDRIRRAAEA